jgi:prepilin-type N-terminal cleavage/methylation domain-containing protein
MKSKQRGFTLIEVIIALGVLGIILALVTGSYYGTAVATRRTEERLELLSMGRIALDRIILEINGAMLDPNDATLHPFTGEHGGGWKDPHDQLTFYTSSFDPRPLGIGSNFAEISYYLEKNPDLETYFLQHRMNPFPDLKQGEGGITNDLAEQVTGLGFRYQDDNETWNSRWDSSIDGKLPRLVEITIILKGLEGQTVQLQGMAAPRMWTPPTI